MDKPADVIDRDVEWETLDQCWRSGRPELVLVLGRRRAGKSYLLTRFVRARRGVYYQATRTTEREQIRALSRTIGAVFADAPAAEGATFETWEALFQFLIRRAQDAPLALILDEFPFLSDAAPALPSILQSLWDHEIAGTRLKIILSGSHISAMQQLTAADQPLFGRRTRQLHVLPFGYRQSAVFTPDYGPRDRLVLYGAVGGLPGYLAMLDPNHTVHDNIIETMLTRGGHLSDEASHGFDAFLSDAEVPYAIVEAIATGEQLWSRIASRVGKQPSSVTRALQWLIDMEVVARVAPLTEYPRPNHKSVRYRLTDPYLAFWHRFVRPAMAMGAVEIGGPPALWDRFIAPGLNDYMGAVFEDVCRAYVREAPASLPFTPTRVGEWWSSASDVQVDVVATGAGGELLIGECKWGAVTRSDLAVLRAKGAAVAEAVSAAIAPVTSTVYALFSGRRASEAAWAREQVAGPVVHVGVEELFS